jgi:hypothetical protein
MNSYTNGVAGEFLHNVIVNMEIYSLVLTPHMTIYLLDQKLIYRERNIVTSWKKTAFKAIGIDSPIEHDERYRQADEYLRVLYKLWEGSWSNDAIINDVENDAYIDPDKIRTIKHNGKYFNLETRHIVDPSPQRTPFLFQAGTSP